MILHTESTGSGVPIVFLHTGLQTGKTELEEQSEYFKGKYQVILPDLRGHGNSVTDDFSNYFHAAAADLAETLEELGVASAHIAGCSLGALVGLVLAKHYPQKVRSLILSGIIPEKPADWEEMLELDAINEAKLLEKEDVVEYFNHIHKGDWRKLLQSQQSPEWYPFQETGDLSGLHMPILFIAGEENPYETIGATYYPKMNENVHVSIIPFAGHVAHLDQPDIYNRIVECFLGKAESLGTRKI